MQSMFALKYNYYLKPRFQIRSVTTLLPIILSFTYFEAIAQFDGKAGSVGSKAIFKDSSIFVNWAKSCVLSRGFQNILKPEIGLSNAGSEEMAVGKAGQNGVVSLGDGGSAILTFHKPIRNGTGPDFAVFENGFADNFLELAFVEVSSDGVKFVRFPAISNTQTTKQIGPFDTLISPRDLYNLAGKYRLFYGTPFDLEEIKDSLGLNINQITHVKIIDVVGSIQQGIGSFDSKRQVINDPFPTEFPASGFDLDAVGVINQASPEATSSNKNYYFYPNPCNEILSFSNNSTSVEEFSLYNQFGEKVVTAKEPILNLKSFQNGIYYAVIITDDRKKITQRILKLN